MCAGMEFLDGVRLEDILLEDGAAPCLYVINSGMWIGSQAETTDQANQDLRVQASRSPKLQLQRCMRL